MLIYKALLNEWNLTTIGVLMYLIVKQLFIKIPYHKHSQNFLNFRYSENIVTETVFVYKSAFSSWDYF